MSALHDAVRARNLFDEVRQLLQIPAVDVNAKDSGGIIKRIQHYTLQQINP